MNNKTFEAIFLLLTFSILLWSSYATLADHKLTHDFPYGYLASDAFQDQTRAEGIKDAGNYLYEPFFVVAGFKDVVGYYPPILNHASIIFSYITGTEVYDSIYFLVFFAAILSAFVMYILIKKFSPSVAILAIPLTIFIFSTKTYNGFTWGRWAFMVGSLFLIATAWGLSNIKLKKSYILLGIFLSAALLAHQTEFMFISLFILLFIILKFFIYKPLEIKKLAYAFVVFLIISIYFLIIFRGSFMESVPYSFSVDPDWGNTPLLYPKDFHILLIPMIAGFIISLLYLKKKFTTPIYLGIFMLVIGYMNYIGFSERSFQTRYFWPIYFSVFFGLGLYYAIKFFSKKKIVFMATSLILLILFSANLMPLKISKFTTPGLMDRQHWDAFNWINENTPLDAKIYFFYGDSYSQDALLRNSKREHYVVRPTDFAKNLENQTINRFYKTRIPGDSGAFYPYRTSFFNFEFHWYEVGGEEFRTTQRDVCNYDYYVFDKLSQQPVLAQYNLIIANKFMENEWFEPVYDNSHLVILKNNQPGDDCIEKQKFS